MIDRMPETAHHNIIICTVDGDGDLVITSLYRIRYEEEDLRSMRPSEALKAFIGDTSGNQCEILGVYGTGSWYTMSVTDD
jgi:hypothetical protein